ncbi:MAG TPA: succinylglutamate desuccinylase/aspartoacylase family protein [Candidatus Aminicenantes bacterium]|nr:succinylglutamate desuccinylase/aspartoacylase family protein [Candidatus Aminicenantes bacterium]HRY64627.1 succinylglutamate desuccinylase/aspartoacylase family protein [Candidatus Aminicenantes bacterium]HRZ71540.1 succinylglutamate desuccinylase/aspartoacylase family protein [Candidatus Aminicenantes bacterium]
MMRKLVSAAIGTALAVFAGISFHHSRHLREPVVPGPAVSRVATLGDYFAPLKGTINDANIYILEGKEPGGTVLLLGGTHPEEPAGRLAAWIFAENAELRQGRILLVLSANRSGTTATRIGGAYPADFTIPTAWGGQTFRMGDRWSNPLDQWPDPEVYLHYPSRQQLAYVDIRNLNRCFPGRPDGLLTERTCYAICELIRREKVDIEIDFHEAELQYPVISTIVAHERGADLAAAASMFISSLEGFAIGVENSPKALRGLSHREIGDATGAISLLLEAPEPFLDATRGRTDRRLLLTGRDPFVVRAGRRGLLFEKIDEKGWPIDVRVGRHTSTVLQVLEIWSGDHPDRAVVVAGVPRYAEVVEKGTGAFLKDPKSVDPGRLSFE